MGRKIEKNFYPNKNQTTYKKHIPNIRNLKLKHIKLQKGEDMIL